MATSKIPFSYDRILETISRPIYTGKAGKTVVVTNLHISNPVHEDYTIEFLLITPGRNTIGMLYPIKLLAGYWVIDDTEYRLQPNAAIWAKSNKTTVNVVINGYEEITI